MSQHNIHNCNVCGLQGHKSSRSQFCLARPENKFKIGSLVGFSLPEFHRSNAVKLWDKMRPGWRTDPYYPWERIKDLAESGPVADPRFQSDIMKSGPDKGCCEYRRNIHPARVVGFNGDSYELQILLRFYRNRMWNTVVTELQVPVHFREKRVIFPLRSRMMQLPAGEFAMWRGAWNLHPYELNAVAIVPNFPSRSGKTGETSKDRMAAYMKTDFYKKEAAENKMLITKTCELPDELFREVMEFAYRKPSPILV